MITLNTLKDATAQEVFDQVKGHLLKQNETCLDARGKCKYRFGELKCAAGCLIADDEYKEIFEGKTWFGLDRDGLVSRSHYVLICDLQSVHDNNDVSLWPAKLAKVAENHNLKYE